jgi:hypothetical protein
MRLFRAPLAPALVVAALPIVMGPVSAASWRPVVTLASGGQLTGSDSVVASGATVHAVYTRGGAVIYERSTDAGRTFVATTLVRSTGVSTYGALGIAAYADRVAILYGRSRSDSPTRTLYAKVSLDGGRHWSAPTTVAAWTQAGGPLDAAIAVTSTTFFVAATVQGRIDAWHSTRPTTGWHAVAGSLGQTTNRQVQNDPTRRTGDVAIAAWAAE